MSSILDALTKLEEEKAAHRAGLEPDVAPASPADAAVELLGASGSRQRPMAGSRIWAPVVTAVSLAVALTTVAIVALPRVFSGGGSAVPVATPAPDEAPMMHTYSLALRPETHDSSGETVAPAADRVSEGALPVVMPAPAPAHAQYEAVPADATIEPTRIAMTPPAAPPPPVPAVAPAAVPIPAPEPARALPEVSSTAASFDVPEQEHTPLPTRETLAAQSTPPTAFPDFVPPPTPAAPPEPRFSPDMVDVDSLPRLSANDRSKLGLGDLKLNVLREADDNQPDALAIINLKKVYVGEMIPGTRARLIAVKANGIGIEIDSGGTRQRFRVPR